MQKSPPLPPYLSNWIHPPYTSIKKHKKIPEDNTRTIEHITIQRITMISHKKMLENETLEGTKRHYISEYIIRHYKA